MKCACINCLCHFCTREKCRFKKARQSDICSVRCIRVTDKVNYNRVPVLVCDKFVHATLHKHYRISNIRSNRQNSLASISLKDFLKALGGDK